MKILQASLMMMVVGMGGLALADVPAGDAGNHQDMTTTAKPDMTTAPIVSADDGCSMARHQAAPLGFLGLGLATAFMFGRRKK